MIIAISLVSIPHAEVLWALDLAPFVDALQLARLGVAVTRPKWPSAFSTQQDELFHAMLHGDAGGVSVSSSSSSSSSTTAETQTNTNSSSGNALKQCVSFDKLWCLMAQQHPTSHGARVWQPGQGGFLPPPPLTPSTTATAASSVVPKTAAKPPSDVSVTFAATGENLAIYAFSIAPSVEGDLNALRDSFLTDFATHIVADGKQQPQQQQSQQTAARDVPLRPGDDRVYSCSLSLLASAGATGLLEAGRFVVAASDAPRVITKGSDYTAAQQQQQLQSSTTEGSSASASGGGGGMGGEGGGGGGSGGSAGTTVIVGKMDLRKLFADDSSNQQLALFSAKVHALLSTTGTVERANGFELI